MYINSILFIEATFVKNHVSIEQTRRLIGSPKSHTLKPYKFKVNF